MRIFFKIGFGLGALLLVGSAAPACSSSDSGGSGGKPATGGTGGTGAKDGGGTGGGGTGGAAGGGGAAGSGNITCGTKSCTGSWTIKGLLGVQACCAGSAKDACGVQVDSTIETVLGIPQGCYPLNEPGKTDCNCDPYLFTNPLPPPPQGQFNGCCRTDGKCGVYIDLSPPEYAGPNMGCQEATPFLKGGTPGSCTVGQEKAPPADPDAGPLGPECPVGDGGTTDGGGGASDAAAD